MNHLTTVLAARKTCVVREATNLYTVDTERRINKMGRDEEKKWRSRGGHWCMDDSIIQFTTFNQSCTLMGSTTATRANNETEKHEAITVFFVDFLYINKASVKFFFSHNKRAYLRHNNSQRPMPAWNKQ